MAAAKSASTTYPTVGGSQPLIVLLSLHKESFFDDLHADVIRQLAARATVKELTDLQEVGEYLSTHKASAIIVTDEAIIKKPNVSSRLVDYVRNGGTLILGTYFPNAVRPFQLSNWFGTAWNLPWETANYHRSTTTPNPRRSVSRLSDEKLPGPYSQKALGLKNVPDEAAVYTDPDDDENCPVVFASFGKGYLGYMGDVNCEEESTKVLLAMCGL